MKTRWIQLPLLIALAAISALAQKSMIADVKFDFQVGDTRLAAGQYVFEQPSQYVLRVSAADRKARVLLIAIPARLARDGECKVVFSRYGDHSFLSEVWMGDGTPVLQLPRSKAEREIAARIQRLAEVPVVARKD